MYVHKRYCGINYCKLFLFVLKTHVFISPLYILLSNTFDDRRIQCVGVHRFNYWQSWYRLLICLQKVRYKPGNPHPKSEDHPTLGSHQAHCLPSPDDPSMFILSLQADLGMGAALPDTANQWTRIKQCRPRSKRLYVKVGHVYMGSVQVYRIMLLAFLPICYFQILK